jgi:hypothetical protein
MTSFSSIAGPSSLAGSSMQAHFLQLDYLHESGLEIRHSILYMFLLHCGVAGAPKFSGKSRQSHFQLYGWRENGKSEVGEGILGAKGYLLMF